MAFQASSTVKARSPNVTQAGDPSSPVNEAFKPEVVAQMRRILEDVVKDAVRTKSFFRERDLLKGVQKKSQKEVQTPIIEDKRFVELIEWTIAQRPLVEIGTTNTFTTPEMVEMERQMLDLAGRENEAHMLKEDVVAAAIAAKKGISEEQTDAVLAACRTPKNVTVIEGTAGAGKSFTMQAIKEAYIAMGYDVMGTALSWNAAKVLEEATGMGGGSCVAMEGLVQNMIKARDTGTDFFRAPTLLIVDEAGMVGTRHMYHLCTEAARSPYPVKIVLTGDSLQVNPVDAGNALQAIIEYHGTTRIDTIRRQVLESHRTAVRRFSKRQAGKALFPYVHQEAVRWCPTQEDQFNMVVRDFLSYRLANPNHKALILALSNKNVSELNKKLRSAYRKMGLIDPYEVEITVTDGRESWLSPFSVGDEVVLRANSKDMMKYAIDPSASTIDESSWVPVARGIFNRNAGRIVGIRRGKKPVGSFEFIVDLAGDSPARVIINNEEFKHQERRGMPMVHNFATTIYASQGQTVQQVFLIDSPQMEFRLAYVGMSRHTNGALIYFNESELHERLDRMVGKTAPIDDHKQASAGYVRPGDGPVLPVKLGRYRRSEMLQAAASVWAKDSENLTAMIYERRQRLGRVIQEPIEELAKVVQGSADDKVIDFLVSAKMAESAGLKPADIERQWAINDRIPLVDLAKVMELPDPIAESELVRPSEVAENRLLVSPTVIPLRQRHGPDTTAPETGGALARLARRGMAALFGDDQDAQAVAAEVESLRRPDPADPFYGNEHEPASSLHPGNPEALDTVLDAIGVKARGALVDIPMLPLEAPVGSVNEDGVLCFDGVPQTAGAAGGPSSALLARTRGLLWDVGRGHEPRILALDQKGSVAARYRLDGKCVVGEGYPPMWLNPKGGAASDISIVPGAREWFWMAEHLRERHADDLSKVPHLIWAAQDVDWQCIAGALRGKTIKILRSKTDESQLQWALDLQEQLATRWKITATILPRPPEVLPEVSAEAAHRRAGRRPS